MDIKVPEDVKAALQSASARREAQRRSAELRTRREEERQQALAAEREAHRPASTAHAAFLFEWLAAFRTSDLARDFLALSRQALPVFGARFLDGQLASPADRGPWAVLAACSGDQPLDRFRYQESYRSNPRHSVVMATPEDMVAALPPEFLRLAHEHLVGPDAWKFILLEIEKL